MIYLDNNATTQINPEVLELINRYLQDHWGNPSSNYYFGSRDKKFIESSRESVANLVNATPPEIIFTSCATESNNMAFHSAVNSNLGKKHIITSKVEHSSILEICKALENRGYDVTYLDVNEDGMIDLNELDNALGNKTALVSLMWANNETGVINPVKEISQICRNKDVLFHCDAVQAVGKTSVDLSVQNIDYLSISAHKIHGAKGIGALYVRSGVPMSPLIIGGGQENGMRGGTYNTAYIAGFGKAAEIAYENLDDYQYNLKRLRDWFEDELLKLIPTVYFSGKKVIRLSNTCNFGITGIDSDILLNILGSQNILASTGSACSSATLTPSHVISAMKGYEKANEAIRISLSSYTSKKELEITIEALKEAVDSF